MSEIDWSTTTACPRCHMHGPLLPKSWLSDPEADRELHRAGHTLAAALLAPATRILDLATRTAGRHQEDA